MVTACKHENFAAFVEVARITDTEDGPVVGYAASVKIDCAECGEPFCFRGVPMGISQLGPTQSFDGTTLRAPIHPMSDPTTGIGLAGMTVTIREAE